MAEFKDDLIEMKDPLQYDVQVEKQNENLYVHGSLELPLHCKCKRCLKEFEDAVELRPYHLYVPLEGDDAATPINDMVDLTPYFRENTLLALPQHPLCSEDCKGIATASGSKSKSSDKSQSKLTDKSAWSELDKLKF